MPSSALKLVGVVVRPYGKPGLTPKGLSQVYFLVKVSDNIHTVHILKLMLVILQHNVCTCLTIILF